VHNIELFFEVAWFNCDVGDLVGAFLEIIDAARLGGSKALLDVS